jgi:hypothetical protein
MVDIMVEVEAAGILVVEEVEAASVEEPVETSEEEDLVGLEEEDLVEEPVETLEEEDLVEADVAAEVLVDRAEEAGAVVDPGDLVVAVNGAEAVLVPASAVLDVPIMAEADTEVAQAVWVALSRLPCLWDWLF